MKTRIRSGKLKKNSVGFRKFRSFPLSPLSTHAKNVLREIRTSAEFSRFFLNYLHQNSKNDILGEGPLLISSTFQFEEEDSRKMWKFDCYRYQVHKHWTENGLRFGYLSFSIMPNK